MKYTQPKPFTRQAFQLVGFLLLLLVIQCGGSSSISSLNTTSSDSFTLEELLSDENLIALLEENEEFSADNTTVFANTNNAFSLPLPNLGFAQNGIFKTGNSFFTKDWVIAPASTTARDGLGPLFNAPSCARCHGRDGRGRPPLSPEEEPVALLFRLSIPGETEDNSPKPDPNYGGQFNNFSIGGIGDEEVLAEGSIQVTYTETQGTYDDGSTYSLRIPNYEFTNLAYGDLHEEIMISPRVGPQMIGLGLLEAINEENILSHEDPDDDDNDGISGKANFVWDVENETETLGRFGWKANQPSLKQQVAGAFLGDIGITSSLFSNENCTASQLECQNTTNGGEPEIEDSLLDAVVLYSSSLAVPIRRNFDNVEVLRGKALFSALNCTSCHTPSFTTGSDHPIEALHNKKIRPYTDLLLHDMGADLADNRPDFLANGNEWRTPPLWGIGLFQTVNNHTFYLHDGRARNLEEAVLWHGGEAENSRNQFKSLSQSDREALISFLNSL